MKIKLELLLDRESANKFKNLMEAVKSDFEIEDEEELEIVNAIITQLHEALGG